MLRLPGQMQKGHRVKWTNVSISELYSCIGLIFYMNMVKMSSLNGSRDVCSPVLRSTKHLGKAIRRRTTVLLGHRLSSIGLVCQANFGPRRCRREPTPQSAYVATSLSASACALPEPPGPPPTVEAENQGSKQRSKDLNSSQLSCQASGSVFTNLDCVSGHQLSCQASGSVFTNLDCVSGHHPCLSLCRLSCPAV
ncbi:hypothetical protein DPX16_20077 [Anabarilius grahami]|uniref:Uncharacterized protein n=1 Tax=Anabarilius grahami TaxID=495550 RepID=A0A3N0XQV0_ANAGA|nr:hypothetical protein DPX16_20077 [Anabarilius grahami]